MIAEIQYRLIKLIVTMMGMLPGKALAFLSDIIGLLWYHIDKQHRKVVIENVTLAFPGQFSQYEAERFAVKIFQHTASILFEAFWAYGQPGHKIFKYFLIKNIEHFHKAHAKGRGTIILTCHLGNFELLTVSLSKAGISKNAYCIYRALDFKPLDRFVREIRQRFGGTMLSRGGASEKIKAVLKNGGTMVALFDQDSNWHYGVFTEFFGRPACSSKIFAKLVENTNAIVVPMFIRKSGKYYITEFLPEVPWEETGCPIKNLEKNTQNYVSAVESMIRQCPEQYFWVHNRWHTKAYDVIANS
jgi:Kdo2-lipid IVA lauroyltransferase/acyltransferase